MSKVRVLVENTDINKNGIYRVENGLSLLIEHDGKNILFDTGQSDAFMLNAKQTDFNIRDIDYLIISHAHFDHGGGLRNFLKNNTKARVFLHKKALLQYYTKVFMVFPIYIGLDRSVLTEYAERIELLEKDTEIIKGLDILTGIERIYPLPSTNKALYVKVNGRLIRDTFDHEIILTILNNGKLSVFSGCSHSGIINILDKVRQKYPDFKINNVFGGFHLFNPVTHITEKPDYIICLANKLNQNEGIFYTGHCTGEKGFRIMKRILRDKLNRFRTGMEINLF